MMKRIVSLALIVFVSLSIVMLSVFAAAIEVSAPGDVRSTVEPTISEDYIPSETTSPEATEPEEIVIILDTVVVKRDEPTTYDEAETLLKNAIERLELINTIYEGLLTLGYAEDHPAVVMAKTDTENAQADVVYYQEQFEIFEEIRKWEVRASEYPVATKVWLYMKNEFGWNDIVCAGIMGNMMAECGGCWTSDLDWDLNEPGGFGMIQWLGSRRKQLFSIYGKTPSIENQLNFMKDELYGTNGVSKQVSEKQLNKIMNAETPEECAFAFASYFERCSEKHRAPRKGYARTAYEYFVG